MAHTEATLNDSIERFVLWHDKQESLEALDSIMLYLLEDVNKAYDNGLLNHLSKLIDLRRIIEHMPESL